MTHFDYYATTGDKFSRAVQYGGYPLAEIAGYFLFKDRERANVFAKFVSTGLYAALTTTFFGRETNMIDNNAREAVSAAMGIDADKLTFSDYKHSSNVIARRAYEDVLSLQKYRYGTDAMFIMPLVVDGVYRASTGKTLRANRDIRRDAHHSIPKEKRSGIGEFVADGTPAWNMGVYAAKAGYWGFETFLVDKSGHYEIVKLKENLESTGKDMSANDLLGVYQRTRSNDRQLPMIERAEEYEALRPLLQRMADAYNKHDGTFGMAEIVYLLGENKINIHAADNKAVSQEAVAQSDQEIDKVLSIGLSGIREENKRRPSNPATAQRKTFRDRVADGAYTAVQAVIGKNSKVVPKRTEEWISVRDPGELTNWSDPHRHQLTR